MNIFSTAVQLCDYHRIKEINSFLKHKSIERRKNGGNQDETVEQYYFVCKNDISEVLVMQDTVLVAILSLIGTLAGSFGGTQLIKYRIEQLEKKVEKHNSVVERTFLLEEKMKVANHRIEDLEGKVE